ncbi:hypothetical protein M1141_01545 [Candidatus Marsarchaeota archaeon]|nr:hypothetical protein [Candidatus Marsarchaeota archaeon]
MAKILSLVISTEREKIEMALNFSKRQKEAGNDVEVLFFGPSERVLAENSELYEKVSNEFKEFKPSACVFIAEQVDKEDKLKKVANMVKGGSFITESIEKGYAVITF